VKKLFLSALLFSAAILSAADLTGLYAGKGVKADQKYGPLGSDFQIGLTQAGSAITGFLIQGKSPAIQFTGGAVSGNQVTISLTEGKVLFTGLFTVDGNQLSGRLTGSDGDVYTIALTKR
jgi:hypothetical protein